MKVFLDTNVLISGFLTRGLSADVVRLVMAEHELITSEVVLRELERVLKEKFGIPTEHVREIVLLLRRFHVEPWSEQIVGIEVRDPDDALVLSSAIAADAEVLVTGDRDLLNIASQIAPMQITDPRGFWDLVRKA